MVEGLSINSTDFEVRRSIRRRRISMGFDAEAGTFFIAAPAKLPQADIVRTIMPQFGRLMSSLIFFS